MSKIHDHVYCWQNSCEELLRNLGILPNPDIKKFTINSSRRSPYNQATGLSPISDRELTKRLKKLKYWKDEIKTIRNEAI